MCAFCLCACRCVWVFLFVLCFLIGCLSRSCLRYCFISAWLCIVSLLDVLFVFVAVVFVCLFVGWFGFKCCFVQKKTSTQPDTQHATTHNNNNTYHKQTPKSQQLTHREIQARNRCTCVFSPLFVFFCLSAVLFV